ncbi:tubulin-specific chaperone, putative [Babesia caballi]|uniref:Tubulin-specific chaperone, putative n=1 Tax=Babesia caballi TaxID=5871 RepID=A0AAV4M1Y0_BABCB|nr:tubulin-specific chaperone, putative [Babesia caballi]
MDTMKRLHDMQFRHRVIKVELQHSSLRDRQWPEIRIDNGMTVAALKDKLYAHTGTPPGSMKLYAYLPSDMKRTQMLLDNDSLELYMYGVDDGYVIYILASDADSQGAATASAGGSVKVTNSRLHRHYAEQLERYEATGDDSEFQRFRLTDEEYAVRGKALREFIARMRQQNGVTAPGEGASAQPPSKTLEQLRQEYPVGSRCLVKQGDIRGTVRFVGMVKRDLRIGVELDEPLGDCDGTVNGVHYFTARGPSYGAFYPSDLVEVGNFPELDPFDIA